MDIPLDRFLVKVHKYANTSAASIPVAICDALDAGEIKPDDRLLLVTFGAGLTWAAAVMQMAPTAENVRLETAVAVPDIAELVTA